MSLYPVPVVNRKALAASAAPLLMAAWLTSWALSLLISLILLFPNTPIFPPYFLAHFNCSLLVKEMESFDHTCWKRREIKVISHQTDPLFLIWVRITLRHSVSCSVVSSSLRPHGSSVYGILQARILEWVDIPFSRGSSQQRDQTQVSCIAGGFFAIWAQGSTQTKESWRNLGHDFGLPTSVFLLWETSKTHWSPNFS